MESYFVVLVWVAPPLVGAFIGYWTNRIAIKMLFRPFHHKRLGPIPIPLTPGVIPRNHYILADNVGELVAQELLTQETIQNLFEDPNTRDELRNLIRQQIPAPLRVVAINSITDRVVSYFSGKAPALSEVIDVQKHVSDRIKSFEVSQMEQMILSITGAHLKKLSWFGALLGAMLGSLQLPLAAL